MLQEITATQNLNLAQDHTQTQKTPKINLGYSNLLKTISLYALYIVISIVIIKLAGVYVGLAVIGILAIASILLEEIQEIIRIDINQESQEIIDELWR